MLRSRTILLLLSVTGLAACGPVPDPDTKPAAPAAADSAPPETVPFRANVAYDEGTALPPDAQLIAYVVEGDFEEGGRRIVAQSAVTAPRQSPVEVLLEVPRAELRPELGYLMYAAVTDSDGRLLMSAPMNRPPVPATGLYRESSFNITLQPVVTPSPPEQAFRLPGRLTLECADIEITVHQLDSNDVVLTMAEGEVVLRPAVATSGGRFSDGHTEFWITDEQAFLIMPGMTPRACTMR